jgi:hypothetical protein
MHPAHSRAATRRPAGDRRRFVDEGATARAADGTDISAKVVVRVVGVDAEGRKRDSVADQALQGGAVVGKYTLEYHVQDAEGRWECLPVTRVVDVRPIPL